MEKKKWKPVSGAPPEPAGSEEAADKPGLQEDGDGELMGIFRKHDKRGDGKMSFEEFRDMLTSEGMSTYMPFVSFSMIDRNDDGKIDYGEFVSFAKLVQTPLVQSPKATATPSGTQPSLKRIVTRMIGEPRYLNELVFDSAQTAGSHLGAFFHSDNGEKFYVKFPGLPPIHGDSEMSRGVFAALMASPRDFYQEGRPTDSDQAVSAEEDSLKQSELVRRQTKSEVLVSKLYAMVGIEAAVMRLVYIEGAEEDGPVGCWSRNMDYEDIGQREMARLPGLNEGFAADAWLANWDVVGNGAPHELNLKRTKAGRAFRLDFGGCLQYRAQGSDKSTAGCPFVPDSVAEIRNLQMYNYPFRHITPADATVGVEKIAAVSDDAIRDVVTTVLGKDAVYEETTVADVLIGRKQALQRQFPPPETLRISCKRGARFYTDAATAILKGAEEKAPVHVLHITALGNAIPIAAAVSGALAREKLGRVAKLRTGYGTTEANGRRGSAKLSITVHSS